MSDWLWRVPLCTGIGVGAGVVAAGFLAARRRGVATAALVGIAVGVIAAVAIRSNWNEILGGVLGGVAGAFGAAAVVQGALRRGGTRGGTAALVGVAGVGLAALALVPVVGYVEALALPAFAARLRRRAGERYAGLRTLARD
jgi:hypothetical protein